jgi:hypothetical protein
MTNDTAMAIRVWVEDVWDSVELPAAPDWTIARMKEEALRAATGREHALDDYHVKYHGALVLDERRTLGDLGASPSARFIVLSIKRRPVR